MNFNLFLILLYFFINPAFAQIKIVATTPDLAYLAHTIGGSHVEVFSLLDGTEDPHFVDAVPLFIHKTSAADIFIQVGLGLEDGWVPKVIQKSGNRKIQAGSEGLCIAGEAVEVLDKTQGKTQLNRTMGDVHGEGNPHFHLSPKHYHQAALKVYQCLKSIFPKEEHYFKNNLLLLQSEIDKSIIAVNSILTNSKTKLFAEYHKQFLYFFHFYKLKVASAIEEIPGVPPSAGRIAQRAEKAKLEGLHLVIAADHQNEKILRKFKELSGVNYLRLPAGLRDQFLPNSYYDWQLNIAKKIANE